MGDYTDEGIAKFFAGIISALPIESQYPRWFSRAVILAKYEGGFAQMMGRPLAPTAKAAYEKLRLVLDDVREALDEGVGPATEQCLRDYVRKYLEEVDERADFQGTMVKRFDDEQAEGIKRGHAAMEFNWMDELDKRPDWMERKPRGNGMGWKVSAQQIVDIIIRLEGCPEDYTLDPSTVTKERKRRLKKLQHN